MKFISKSFKIIATIFTLLFFISCSEEEKQVIIEQIKENNPELISELLPSEPTPTVGLELIENGSFEQGHSLGNNKWNVFASIPGWSANLDCADAPIEIQNGINIGGIAPSNGTAKLEMDSHNKNGFSESDAHIYQSVSTMQGYKYKLKIDYTPRVKNCNGSCDVEVIFADQVIAVLEHDEVAWQTYEFEIDGTGSVDRLELRAFSDNDTIGGYIDNVSLQAMPF